MVIQRSRQTASVMFAIVNINQLFVVIEEEEEVRYYSFYMTKVDTLKPNQAPFSTCTLSLLARCSPTRLRPRTGLFSIVGTNICSRVCVCWRKCRDSRFCIRHRACSLWRIRLDLLPSHTDCSGFVLRSHDACCFYRNLCVSQLSVNPEVGGILIHYGASATTGRRGEDHTGSYCAQCGPDVYGQSQSSVQGRSRGRTPDLGGLLPLPAASKLLLLLAMLGWAAAALLGRPFGKPLCLDDLTAMAVLVAGV